MKSNVSLGKVKIEYFGKTVYVTFEDYTTNRQYSKFYKSEASAKSAITKFHKKLSNNYLNM